MLQEGKQKDCEYHNLIYHSFHPTLQLTFSNEADLRQMTKTNKQTQKPKNEFYKTMNPWLSEIASTFWAE